MTKVSSNAGKHPYLRSDNEFLFEHLVIDSQGKKFDVNVQVKFNTVVSTGCYDKNNKELFFNDIIIYKKNEYIVDYDSREFYWIIRNLIDLNNTEILTKKAHLLVFKEKHN